MLWNDTFQENVAEEYFDKDEPSNQKDKKPKSGFQKLKKIFFILVANAAVITYLTFASLTYIENSKLLDFHSMDPSLR